MRRNHIWEIIVFVLAVMLFSCEKEQSEVANAIEDIDVVIGEYSNMDVSYYDTTLIGGYYAPMNLVVDLDGDNENDINFITEIYGSPAVGQIPKVQVECLHNGVQLLGHITYDTIWYSQSVYTVSNDPVEIVVSNIYSCQRINENDEAYKIEEVFELLPMSQGDMMLVSDVYQSDTLVLYEGDLGMPPSMETINDTTYYTYEVTYRNCSDFPLDQVVYIGYKLAQTDKLGWIKMGIYSFNKLVILETVIQK